MTKLVALPLDAAPTLDDLVYLVGSPATVPVDRKTPLGDLASPLAAAPEFTGEYVAQGALIINVKDYGAGGVGISNDTAAVQAAIAAANAVGGAVYFPPGNYLVDNLTMSTAGIALFGPPGRAAKLTKRANGNLLTITGARCSVANLTIDGVGNTYTGVSIWANGATDVDVVDCDVKNTRDSARAISFEAAADRGRVRYCRIEGKVFIRDSDQSLTVGCKFFTSPYSTTSGYFGVEITSLDSTQTLHANGGRILFNEFLVTTYDFAINTQERNGANPPTGIVIAFNDIVAAVACYGGMTIDRSEGARLIGNTFRVATGATGVPLYGIEIPGGGGHTLIGNDIDGGGLMNELININNSSDNEIIGGELKNPAAAGAYALLSIIAPSNGYHADRNRVSGVKFYVLAGNSRCVRVTTNNAGATANDNTIVDCDYFGNASARGVVLDAVAGSIDGTTIGGRFNTIGGAEGAIRLNNDTSTLVAGCRERGVTTRFTVAGTGGAGLQQEGNSWQSAPAAPTTQYHFAGEIVWNSAPMAGGIPGWVCVTAGTPGTWEAIASAGSDPLGIGHPTNAWPILLEGSGNPTSTANRYAAYRVLAGGTITKIAFEVAVAVGNIDVAILRGSTGRNPPTSRVVSSGSVACPAAGYAEVTVASTVVSVLTDWLAFGYTDGTMTVYGTLQANISSTNMVLGSTAYEITYPIPATPSTAARTVPRVPALIGVA